MIRTLYLTCKKLIGDGYKKDLCVDKSMSFPVWILSVFWVRMHICQNPKNHIRLSMRTLLPRTDVLFLVRTHEC